MTDPTPQPPEGTARVSAPDFEAIRKRWSEGTPGPWSTKRSELLHDGEYYYAIKAPDGALFAETYGRSGVLPYHPARFNAEKIAHAPTDIATLLALTDTLQGLVDTLTQQQVRLCDGFNCASLDDVSAGIRGLQARVLFAEDYETLTQQRDEAVKALEAIKKCECAFRMDPLEHAREAVDHCQMLARDALELIRQMEGRS